MQNRRAAALHRPHATETALVQAWCQRTGDALSALQALVLTEGALVAADNLVVSGDARDGLEFVTELAAVGTARRGAAAVIIADESRALALHDQLVAARHTLGREPLRVRLSTRSRGADDGALAARDFAIAVVSSDKLRSLLVRDPGLLDAVGAVIVDGVDQLTDPVRGPTLDAVLTHARQRSAARLIGLTRVCDAGAMACARWLRARVLTRDGWIAPTERTLTRSDRARDRGFEAVILHSVAARLAATEVDLRRVVLTSFHGQTEVIRGARAGFDGALLEARRRWERAGLLRSSTRRVTCTRRGLACATLGLDLETAGARQRLPAGDSRLELLCELCLSPAGRALAAIQPIADGRAADALRADVLRRASDEQVADRPIFRWLLEDLAALEAATAGALACALALHAWCAGEDRRRLAARLGTTVAGLRSTVRAFGWLTAARFEFAALDGARTSDDALRMIAELAPSAVERVRAALAPRPRVDATPRTPRRATPPLTPPPTTTSRRAASARRPRMSPPPSARAAAEVRDSSRAACPQKTPRWSPYGVIWVR